MEAHSKNENFIQVEVVTVSGSYPDEGYLDVPINQKVKVLLDKASKKLGIVDTEGFVASVDGVEIDINSSYSSLGLTGETSIDWSKREGGGGNAERCICRVI